MQCPTCRQGIVLPANRVSTTCWSGKHKSLPGETNWGIYVPKVSYLKKYIDSVTNGGAKFAVNSVLNIYVYISYILIKYKQF